MSDFDSPLNEPPEIAHVAKVVSLDYPPPKEKRSRKQYRRETSIYTLLIMGQPVKA